jgi:hypothetical protein
MTLTTTKEITQNGNQPAQPATLEGNNIEYLKGLQFNIPYTTKLSFAPLLRTWASKTESGDVAERLLAREITERVKKVPAFRQPIEDTNILKEHSSLVELLLAGLFPLNLRDTQLAKASKPFDLNAFYATPAARKMMHGCEVKVKMEKSKEFFANAMIVNVCASILNQCYGQKLEVDPLVIFTMEPEGSGLSYHFKSELNIEFMEVVATKPLKKLTQKQINYLLRNVYDTGAWLEALPPDAFEIHGVVGMNLVDVTKEETISRLRFHLLKKDALSGEAKIAGLETLLRSYFKMPSLRMGIMAMNYPASPNDEFKYKIRHCFLTDWHECLLNEKAGQSLYLKACKYKETILVEDLKAMTTPTAAETGLQEKGFRSFLVAPLLGKNDTIIGLLELGSPEAYKLNSFTELALKEVLPLFNMAMERSREETDNKVEAIIREQFTAIHPSVEWRFVQSAFNYLDQRSAGGKKAVIDPIVFENVYPLYAQADIVSSSVTRNKAIQEDFIHNLKLLKDLLELAVRQVDFPLLHQYLLETEHRLEELSKNLKSTDEPLILEFILKEVHPLLEQAAAKNTSVARALQNYQSRLDATLGVVYQKRKDYEESVTRINTTISEFLEHEEERAQQMVSHYFEKYKTDGVQFELYAGQSVLQNGTFNELHLRNLRLWQLLAMSDITRQMDKLKDELAMPLRTAQLVFVYGQPISVRFRPDDKRFDVDGAYNIRYEIIKKRIDKATVTTESGKRERLTMAGKIAIVYATEKDRLEYMDYLNYLIREGRIDPRVETLELDQLQGVQGLKALRVTVLPESEA